MDELRVAWIGSHAWDGKVGLTLLPGRRDLGPGGHDRVLEPDLATLKREGVGGIVLLCDDAELDATRTADLPRIARSMGLGVIRRPISRHRLPSLTALDELAGSLPTTPGKHMVITCRSGLGRSGVVGAAWLMRDHRRSVAEALAVVREARGPKAAGRRAYEFLLERYATWLACEQEDYPSGSGPHAVPGDELSLELVPRTDAPWFAEIGAFALTFDGYAYIRGDATNLGAYVAQVHREMGGRGESPPPASRAFPPGLSLSDFRALLFRLQRNLHDADVEPGEAFPDREDLAYAQRLVGEIRRVLREAGHG